MNLQDYEDGDPCPQHGTAHRKGYTFGGYGDAEVHVFNGCGCAVCVNEASLLCGVPLGGEITLHDSYSAAEGRARLIVAGESVANVSLQ